MSVLYNIGHFNSNDHPSHPLIINMPLNAGFQYGDSPSYRKLDRSQSEPCNSRTNPNVNSSRYKTELCRPFEEKGYCKYSDKCQFAHGEHELKSITRHPKYKTDLCHKYHTDGVCGYGIRCNFIHNENEYQLNRIIATNKQALILQQQRQRENKLKTYLPAPIQRPTSISYSHSVNHPSSLSSNSSPSLSPTFVDSDSDILSYLGPASIKQNLYDHSSPSAIIDNISHFTDMSPLYVHTPSFCGDYDRYCNRYPDRALDMSDIASELVSIIAPCSPPDSISGDSLSSTSSISCPSPDSKNGLRLPVFAQLGTS